VRLLRLRKGRGAPVEGRRGTGGEEAVVSLWELNYVFVFIQKADCPRDSALFS